jgi:ribosome-binding factor A
MTSDLKIAKVYFSIFGSPELRAKSMKMLEGEKPHIRGIVGSHLRLKFVPSLQFYLDETQEHVERINTLIREIHKGEHRPSDDSES